MSPRCWDGWTPYQWRREMGHDEFILEETLDGNIIVTHYSFGRSNFAELECDGGVVTNSSHFDRDTFDNVITPILEEAGYTVDVPEPEAETVSLYNRIKAFITQ